jgi:hypothetical protein
MVALLNPDESFFAKPSKPALDLVEIVRVTL